jgi:hypothetical protein
MIRLGKTRIGGDCLNAHNNDGSKESPENQKEKHEFKPCQQKNKVWLAMVPRSTKCKTYSFAFLDTHLWRSICMILMEGAYLDKTSTIINHAFLKVLIEECKTSYAENEDAFVDSKVTVAGNPNALICKTFKKIECDMKKDDLSLSKDESDDDDAEDDDEDAPVDSVANSNTLDEPIEDKQEITPPVAESADNSVSVLKINTKRLFKKLKQMELPFFIPFHLLHYDADDKNMEEERVIQLDIHERILFQILHAWNGITRKDRMSLLRKGMDQKNGRYSDEQRQFMESLVLFSRESLFMLLVRARGIFLSANQLDDHVSHEDSKRKNFRNFGAIATEKRYTNPNMMAAASPFYIKDPCPCAEHYYLTRLYHYFQRTFETKKDEIKREVSQDVNEFIDCELLTGMISEMLLLVWDAMCNTDLQTEEGEVIDVKVFNVSVDFKLLETDNSLFKKLAKDKYISCNHTGIIKHVLHMYFYNYGYAMNETKTIEELLIINIKPFIEDNSLTLVSPEDVVLNERFAILERALALTSTNPKHKKELSAFIDKEFSCTKVLKELEDKIKWLMFELIYRRNVHVFPQMSSNKVDVNPRTERFNMTFGLVTDLDFAWLFTDRLIKNFMRLLSDKLECFRLDNLEQLCKSSSKQAAVASTNVPSAKSRKRKNKKEKLKQKRVAEQQKQEEDKKEEEDEQEEEEQEEEQEEDEQKEEQQEKEQEGEQEEQQEKYEQAQEELEQTSNQSPSMSSSSKTGTFELRESKTPIGFEKSIKTMSWKKEIDELLMEATSAYLTMESE